jgi:hypothetical protein
MKRDLKRLCVDEDSPRRRIPGRDELNLAEFPIALLSDRVPLDCKTVYYEDQITDRDTGESITRKVTMTGTDEYGLPTAVDCDVLIGLIQISKEKNNFTDPKVTFSRYELIKLLGWEDESKSYHRIELSLNRWIGVTYYYTAWRDKETETWTNEKFHMLDNISLVDQVRRRNLSKKGQAELAPSWFKWNEVVFRSFQVGYLKPLDLAFYYTLRSSISKQLYRYLDKHFHLRKSPDLVFDLRTLAFEKVGLSRKYDTGEIKVKLSPALDELTQAGFLEAISHQERFFKDGRDWKIRLIRKSPIQAASHQTEQKLALSPLVTELVNRGVTAKTAAELVNQHPAAFIEGKLEQFDWEMTRPKPPKKPAGYLVKSIVDGYNADPNFVSKAERDRRAESKRQSDARAAEDRRQKRAEETSQREKRREEDAYWSKLTPAARAELEARALAGADESSRDTYLSLKRQRMGDGFLATIRREYIRTLIDAEKLIGPPF